MSDASNHMPELPPLCDAIIPRETVEQLFADLAACTEVLEIQYKGDARQCASSAEPSLSQACARLFASQVRAIQVRYRHAGAEWCDTLLALAEGYRLVRLQVPQLAAPANATHY